MLLHLWFKFQYTQIVYNSKSVYTFYGVISRTCNTFMVRFLHIAPTLIELYVNLTIQSFFQFHAIKKAIF